MKAASPLPLAVVALCLAGAVACGSSGSDDPPGAGGSGGGLAGNGGSGGGLAGNGGSTGPANAKAYGHFEVHYVSGVTPAASYAEIGGFMYDGPPAALVLWDKKKTDGECALYQPRTPFCELCATGEVCVDTNVCRKPPATHDVGTVTLTGLSAPSGANPLALTPVTNVAGTTYLCAETLPVPPCAAGGPIALSATGKGDYPSFTVQTQCIAPLVVTNPTVTLEPGKPFVLAWTPSALTTARIDLEFDLSHHGGSKGKVICETADSGSLQVSSTLVDSLLALGVTGFPKADIKRVVKGTTPVGAGQAELVVYSDLSFVVEIPGLISCQTDAECPTGQTCLVPGQMCGVACTTNAQCPTGQICQTSTKSCK
jgi:hypothetical protein